jgi:hypothetical protein
MRHGGKTDASCIEGTPPPTWFTEITTIPLARRKIR